MSYPAVTIIPRQSERAIVLARLTNGRHVQVGAPASREGAHALFTTLDSEQSGFVRDRHGRLRLDNNAKRPHFIGGVGVSFYRVREGSHEFGNVETVPVGRIARRAPKGK